MNRRLWLSATAAVIGTSMLVFAAFAGTAASKQNPKAAKGGTLRLNMSGTDVDFSDPSLAYGTISWQIEYATALKLYNYPDKPKPRQQDPARGRGRVPRHLEGREDVHDHCQERLQVQ
jgi:hypothetical protein